MNRAGGVFQVGLDHRRRVFQEGLPAIRRGQAGLVHPEPLHEGVLDIEIGHIVALELTVDIHRVS